MARFVERCSSRETCDQFGIPAYESSGSGACSSDAESCDTGIQTFVSGNRSESRLFELDVTDPAAPELFGAAHGGGRQFYSEVLNGDLGQVLLGADVPERQTWAYAVEENVYDAQGNSVRDAAGHGITRWHLQTVERGADGLSFRPLVSVPGRAVAVLDADAGSVVSLEPAFDADDRQHVWLRQLEVRDGFAFVQSSLDVGEFVDAGRMTDGLLPLLRQPADACSEDGTYELLVADLRSGEPRLSAPLALSGPPDYSWGFSSYDAPPTEPGIAHVWGGPLSGGRLSVDLSTDPPRIVSYELGR
jgi:hypothetical protein